MNRIADDRSVDGHGDLQAEDIFDLTDGFRRQRAQVLAADAHADVVQLQCDVRPRWRTAGSANATPATPRRRRRLP
ncbi:hypothetical protein OG203_17255 [Nocardia sp. NBC_01499]|uniref:hypothetical protein n=1 Tax=Nocardia sp. NBC_01499 TaxID=2903597 RepID=UPI00386647EC